MQHAPATGVAPAAPVNIDLYARGEERRPIRISAVSPCFNRPQDIATMFEDLRSLDCTGIDLDVIIVDNASNPPLTTIPIPDDLPCRVHIIRNSVNGGGAGGFNFGMRHAVEQGHRGNWPLPEFVWLIDSDARPRPDALQWLVRTLKAHPELCAVGSALHDPLTGFIFELGGGINREKGWYYPVASGVHPPETLFYCDYLAACSMLCRREAVEATGTMPECFLNGDDVDWTLHMTGATGQKLACIAGSIVSHPWRKFQVMHRYYIARNSYAPLDFLGLGARVRFHRALIEVQRAASQAVMGLPQLGWMHIRGIADAASGILEGPAPEGVIQKVAIKQWKDLASAINEAKAGDPSAKIYVHPYLLRPQAGFDEFFRQMAAAGVPMEDTENWGGRELWEQAKADAARALGRFVFGPEADVAIVPTGWPTGWFRGRTMIEVASDGFVVVKAGRLRCAWDALKITTAGVFHSVRLMARGPKPNRIPKFDIPAKTPMSPALQRIPV